MKAVNIGAQMAPDYRIMVQGENITDNFRSRLIKLVIEDKLSLEADTFTLELDDSDGKIVMPRRGSKLEIAIGWQGEELFHKGTFMINSITHTGSPDRLTLAGFSTDLSGVVKEKRSESYSDMTLGAIVKRIADRNTLQTSGLNALEAIRVDHVDQTQESDLQFIVRLAKSYDMIATIKADRLILLKTGTGAAASGKPLENVTIRRREGDKHVFAYTGDNNYIGAKAEWLRLDKASMGEVTLDAVVEPPGNVFETQGIRYLVLPTKYKSQDEAKQAVISAWRKSQRMSATLDFTLAMGRPELIPETPVAVEGFKELIDKYQWIVTTVKHTIDDTGGFISQVALEILLDITLKVNVEPISSSKK